MAVAMTSSAANISVSDLVSRHGIRSSVASKTSLVSLKSSLSGDPFNVASLSRRLSFVSFNSRSTSAASAFPSFCAERSQYAMQSVTPKVGLYTNDGGREQPLKVAKAIVTDTSSVTEGKSDEKSGKSFKRRNVKIERNPKRLNRASQRIPPDQYQILKYPLTTESAIKEIVRNNSLVFVVDKKADKKNIKDAVREILKIKTRKVNTSTLPDGTKKAFIMLSKEYNAADIAKKFKLI